MASPSCNQHPDKGAVIIVSFMDPDVEEPTQALCEECAPAMAATILQASTGRDVMSWLFAPDEEPSEATESAPKKRSTKKAAKTVEEFQASQSGHSSNGTSEEAEHADEDAENDLDPAAVTAATE